VTAFADGEKIGPIMTLILSLSTSFSAFCTAISGLDALSSG
jgi:hypothetical protein